VVDGRGRSGNPVGRPVGITAASVKEYFKRLRIAAHRKVKIDANGKSLPLERKEGDEVDQLTDVAQKVFELTRAGDRARRRLFGDDQSQGSSSRLSRQTGR
jgi:hypothetical protein